jgi:hypothetical protein
MALPTSRNKRSCGPCSLAKRSCDHASPCGRCTSLGLHCVVLVDGRTTKGRKARAAAAPTDDDEASSGASSGFSSSDVDPEPPHPQASRKRERDDRVVAAASSSSSTLASTRAPAPSPAAVFALMDRLARHTCHNIVNLIPAFPVPGHEEHAERVHAAFETAEAEALAAARREAEQAARDAASGETLVTVSTASAGAAEAGARARGMPARGSSSSSSTSEPPPPAEDIERYFSRISNREMAGASHVPLLRVIYEEPADANPPAASLSSTAAAAAAAAPAVDLAPSPLLRAHSVAINRPFALLLGIPAPAPGGLLVTEGPMYFPGHVHPVDRPHYLRLVSRAVMLRLPYASVHARFAFSPDGFVAAHESMELLYGPSGCVRSILFTVTGIEWETLELVPPEWAAATEAAMAPARARILAAQAGESSGGGGAVVIVPPLAGGGGGAAVRRGGGGGSAAGTSDLAGEWGDDELVSALDLL